jgi:hypothetical protein
MWSVSNEIPSKHEYWITEAKQTHREQTMRGISSPHLVITTAMLLASALRSARSFRGPYLPCRLRRHGDPTHRSWSIRSSFGPQLLSTTTPNINTDGNNNNNNDPSEKTEAEKEALKAKREEAKCVSFL